MIDELGITITMSDGVDVSARVYRPEGEGPFPTLFAASPYRYDNDDVPPTMVFLWHEVGPIAWYVARGYAYVHLDVRGSGRSDGEYGFYDARERRDMYEVIEWIAARDWSNGKVGGIGQSYYSSAQWAMAAERPPHLTCIAPYDGHMDQYRGWFFQGGIQCQFAQVWWNNSVRLANKYPANGQHPREVPHDLAYEVSQHQTIDAYWRDRSIDKQLREVDIPVYSIGVWEKRDLHLDGNIRGYHLVSGPKKLAFSNARTVPAALEEFASIAFHEAVLAPFYDHYLKGEETAYLERPDVQYTLVGTTEERGAEAWPPADTRRETLFFRAEASGAVGSLNDGSLTLDAPAADEGSARFAYPDPEWAIGQVAFTRTGPDPVKRVTTFTTPPMGADLDLAGAPWLELFVSTTRTDAQVIAKLTVMPPGGKGMERTVSKGWLRASQRALDPSGAIDGEPYHAHTSRDMLTPGEVYPLRIAMTNLAERVPVGARLRLELTCIDSTITDRQFTHVFPPDMQGEDTYHHDADHPSSLSLPILAGGVG